MNIYTPSSSEASYSPKRITTSRKNQKNLFPAIDVDEDRLPGVAGREMTYELPLSSISTCSSFEGDVFRSDSINTSLSSDVFYIEPPAPKPSPRQSSQSDDSTKRKEITCSLPFSPLSMKNSDHSNQSSELEMHGYRARAIIPPSLNDLDLPAHPFNVFMAIPVAEAKQAEKMRNSSNLSLANISPLSLPSSKADQDDMNLSDISASTFYTYESPQYFPPKKTKRKLSLGMSFPKSGGVSQHQKYCEACGQKILTKDSPK